MSKKRGNKERIRAIRFDQELDDRLEAKAAELNVTFSWLVRDLARTQLLLREGDYHGNLRKMRLSGTRNAQHAGRP